MGIEPKNYHLEAGLEPWTPGAASEVGWGVLTPSRSSLHDTKDSPEDCVKIGVQCPPSSINVSSIVLIGT